MRGWSTTDCRAMAVDSATRPRGGGAAALDENDCCDNARDA